jgi:hypothetical protein
MKIAKVKTVSADGTERIDDVELIETPDGVHMRVLTAYTPLPGDSCSVIVDRSGRPSSDLQR